MADIKVQSPNGDILDISERAFNLLYGPIHGYKVYVEKEIKVSIEPVTEPEPIVKETKKNNRKVKKVNEE